ISECSKILKLFDKIKVMDKKYLIELEFDRVLTALSACTNTEAGHNAALNIVPYSKKEEIKHSLLLTGDAKKILNENGINSFPVQFAANPDKILTSSRLSVQNIIDLAKTLESSRKLKNYLSKNDSVLKQDFFHLLISAKELEEKINNVFDENYNIRDNATSELKRLKTSLGAQIDNLHSSINLLLKDSYFANCLQDTIYTERMGRTVFQVKAAFKSKVAGIVHDVSSSNQTFFIEPKLLVPINNTIRQIECEIEAEIERILYSLSAEFLKIKNELILAYNSIVELDVIFAKAKYSILTNSIAPLITEKKVIKLFQAAHPLLINSKTLVRNDFEIGEKYKSLLITGSNTGGKTVMMKTAGLAVLMAESGMEVCALHAEIYPFKNVFCDIEEKQDIAQSLSTFSAHIKNIAAIIDMATPFDVVLFDELGSGTDPAEGAALARAILEFLAEKDVITISTTHLGELKVLEYENDYFKNACTEFDSNTMKPLYKLTIGLAGNSYAIEIAQNYGLKKEIIDSSRKNLNINSNKEENVFNKIQNLHKEIMQDAKQAEETKTKLSEKEEEFNAKLNEIKEKKKKTLENFKKKYRADFEKARQEIKTVVDELYKEKSEKAARRAYSRVAKIEEQLRNEFKKDEDDLEGKFLPVDWNEIKIGQCVLVKKINQPAVLNSMPDSKGMAEISIGLIKSKIHKSKLAKTDKKLSKGIKKLEVSFDDFHNNASFSPKVDLRGMRADEAIDSLEHHLDLAIRRNICQFTIIHGHGTGVLKKAVREYLTNSPYVLKFRSGTDAEGGEGVCIVDVK
ncbi:MAG: Smr/MutS family protein, partial [Candidatus Gastranaerophilales bacterium]|nr:Smr/MutS family protein [Candidatus Gastranaerophilales bacterium]